jgi:hypothetical protein
MNVSKKNHAGGKLATAALGWRIVECHKNVLVIDVAGKLVRIHFKPLRLKGKPRYTVPPDCDPTMW